MAVSMGACMLDGGALALAKFPGPCEVSDSSPPVLFLGLGLARRATSY